MSESLTQRVEPLVRAGYSGLWIESNEVDEVERELLELGSEKQWVVGVWDFCRGLRFPHSNGLNEKYTPAQVVGEVEVGSSGALAVAVKRNMRIEDAPNIQADTPGKRLVIVLEHFYRFLENAGVVQGLYNVLLRAKAERVTFVVVGPSSMVPVELDTLFLRLEWNPPTEAVLEKIAAGLLDTEAGEVVPEGAARAALGLTRREAENAFALGLAKQGKIEVEEVWHVKGHQINSTGFLQFSQGGTGFESLGGLSGLKQFGKRLLRSGNTVATKGLLLLGPAGTGKSAFAKALGAECGRPTLSLDMGALYNKHVGETEGRLRQALKVADAMGEVVLFVDEIDKALAGADSEGDSGVSARVFGTLLTWLNDREERGSKVFFVGTCLGGGTLVESYSGELCRIDSVNSGYQYLGAEGNFHDSVQVVHGVKDTVLVETSTTSIRCTPDHRFFVFKDGQIVEEQAQNLQGCYIVSDLVLPHGVLQGNEIRFKDVEVGSRSASVVQPEYLTPDLSYVAGYLCGDGGYCKRGPHSVRVQWSDASEEMCRIVADCMSILFAKSAKVCGLQPRANAYYGSMDSVTVASWFIQNLPEVLVKGSHNRSVPACIHTASRQLLAEFLAGLFDAEGHFGISKIQLGMTSELCVKQTVLLLQRFDIQSSYRKKISKQSNRRPSYWLTIGDWKSLKNFMEKIPVRNSNKQNVTYKQRWGGNGVRDVPAMKEQVRVLIERNGGKVTNLPHFKNSNSMISADLMQVWLLLLQTICVEDPTGLEEIQAIWSKKWVQVKQVVPAEPCEVFDLSIDDESHAFLANGLLVHNCNDPGRLTAPSGGAFVRAERFDGMFFLDLPTKQDRDLIWQMYGEKFLGWVGKNQNRSAPDAQGWTGAEVRACCRLAAVLDVSLVEAAKHIVPVSVTASEQIQALRAWANGRCCSAETGTIYYLKDRNQAAERGDSGSKKRVVEGPLTE